MAQRSEFHHIYGMFPDLLTTHGTDLLSFLLLCVCLRLIASAVAGPSIGGRLEWVSVSLLSAASLARRRMQMKDINQA